MRNLHSSVDPDEAAITIPRSDAVLDKAAIAMPKHATTANSTRTNTTKTSAIGSRFGYAPGSDLNALVGRRIGSEAGGRSRADTQRSTICGGTR